MSTATARFERHDTPHGQRAMQELHDTAVNHGARCYAKNVVSMASGHESDTIQQMHDLATDHGARCHSLSGSANASFSKNIDLRDPAARREWLTDLGKRAGLSQKQISQMSSLSDAKSGGMTEERRKQLLGSTEMGRSILREREQAKKSA